MAGWFYCKFTNPGCKVRTVAPNRAEDRHATLVLTHTETLTQSWPVGRGSHLQVQPAVCTQMVDTAPCDRPSAPGVAAQAHLSHPRGAAIVSAIDRGDHVGAALDDGLLHGERVRHLVRGSVRVGVTARVRVRASQSSGVAHGGVVHAEALHGGVEQVEALLGDG
eukprot:scaffold32385_cov54-Phaeocystis_antarctica.AAC.2